MNKLLTYWWNDMKQIFRDPILYVMLFVPFIIICLLRWGLPQLAGKFYGLEPYSLVILGTFCLIIAMFPAFIYSFIILDEKDQDVITVIRVLPISLNEFLLIRLLFITVFAFLFIILTISLTNLLVLPLYQIVLAALPISLVAPVASLFICGFARNKVEGATWMKALNFILFLPVLSYFFDAPFEYLLGILPSYWIYKLLDPGFSKLPFQIIYIIALSYNLALLFAGIRIFKHRVFP